MKDGLILVAVISPVVMSDDFMDKVNIMWRKCRQERGWEGCMMMKSVQMIFITEKSQRVVKQSPQMLDMAVKIEAVGGVDIVPMNPISERVYLAYDAQERTRMDRYMTDGKGRRSSSTGKGCCSAW
ncbi:MAG: hypothetical protein V8Q36_00995 [Anaerotignum sp.]